MNASVSDNNNPESALSTSDLKGLLKAASLAEFRPDESDHTATETFEKSNSLFDLVRSGLSDGDASNEAVEPKVSTDAEKAKEDSVLVLDDLSFKTPKTKDFLSVLKNVKIDGDKSLFVTSEKDQNTFLSSRNLKNAKVITADKLNTYDILYSHKLIISENAFDQIEKLFKV